MRVTRERGPTDGDRSPRLPTTRTVLFTPRRLREHGLRTDQRHGTRRLGRHTPALADCSSANGTAFDLFDSTNGSPPPPHVVLALGCHAAVVGHDGRLQLRAADLDAEVCHALPGRHGLPLPRRPIGSGRECGRAGDGSRAALASRPRGGRPGGAPLRWSPSHWLPTSSGSGRLSKNSRGRAAS